MSAPNAERGETALELGGERLALRPSFAALVAAEAELGPLFDLVERAADGKLSLGDLVALFWHCLVDRERMTREALGEAVLAMGLARTTPVLKAILQQILAGK
ncbi:gene transfer agent family protein [Sphingobium sp. BYY-5]|uniref:gene transfer agent family protein n=1 Tax=Sphingobium sp. BYY-5 TaxID=2926400 RepID=UPI001FA7896B|nr:gene transfer agent family protein [Sphingobium sp. BYY-5]MCI4589843.1 gene transfer agent family protein [Sphingobium sp. BYY-5]